MSSYSRWSHIDKNDLWLRTISGKQILLTNPKPEDFDIYDIAMGLANECRWGSQSPRHYSVAQHSCNVARIVEQTTENVTPNLIKHAMMHDASEAFLKDIPRPLKVYLGRIYYDLQDQWQAAIYAALQIELTTEIEHAVEKADEVAIINEAKLLHNAEGSSLMDSGWLVDDKNHTACAIPDMILEPTQAYHLFMNKWIRTTSVKAGSRHE